VVTEGGGRSTEVNLQSGQVRVIARPFNNEESEVTLNTPFLSAIVRGTEFGVSAGNEESAVAVVEGTVGISLSEGSENPLDISGGDLVYVNPDLSNEIIQIKLDSDPTINYDSTRLENGDVQIEGITEIYNLVYINGTEITKEEGTFTYTIPAAEVSEAIIEIVTPLGVEISTTVASQTTF